MAISAHAYAAHLGMNTLQDQQKQQHFFATSIPWRNDSVSGSPIGNRRIRRSNGQVGLTRLTNERLESTATEPMSGRAPPTPPHIRLFSLGICWKRKTAKRASRPIHEYNGGRSCMNGVATYFELTGSEKSWGAG